MKNRFFASDPMTSANPFQFDSSDNGALSLACQRAQPYVVAARAAGTRDVYRRAFARWVAWCAAMHTSPLPAAPETVAAYLAELAGEGKSVATIKGALAAILYTHRTRGHGIGAQAPAIATVIVLPIIVAGKCGRPAQDLSSRCNEQARGARVALWRAPPRRSRAVRVVRARHRFFRSRARARAHSDPHGAEYQGTLDVPVR
jgi:hypothetical protein